MSSESHLSHNEAASEAGSLGTDATRPPPSPAFPSPRHRLPPPSLSPLPPIFPPMSFPPTPSNLSLALSLVPSIVTTLSSSDLESVTHRNVRRALFARLIEDGEVVREVEGVFEGEGEEGRKWRGELRGEVERCVELVSQERRSVGGWDGREGVVSFELTLLGVVGGRGTAGARIESGEAQVQGQDE